MNWPLWLFILVMVGLTVLLVFTTMRAIAIVLMAVTVWLAFDFDVWSWVPWVFWILVLATPVALLIGYRYLAWLLASTALALAVVVVAVSWVSSWDINWPWSDTAQVTLAPPDVGDGSVEVTTTTDVPVATTITTEAPAEVGVVCATWPVSQSDTSTTKWIEEGLTADDPETARQEMLSAIKVHPDLLVATAKVFYASLGIDDPAALQWQEFVDNNGCLTMEGRDLHLKAETLLLAQKWNWQIPCQVGNGTGINADGEIVMRDGLGRVADHGCYVFASVEMGEDPLNPDARETGIIIGSVSKFCGNINPPDKPPHIPPGPTPEPPPEEPPSTTTPPTTTPVTTPPGTSVPPTVPPVTVPPDTTVPCGLKNSIDEHGNCVPNTVVPTVAPPPTTAATATTAPQPPTPPPTAPPDTLPPGVTPTTYVPDVPVVTYVPPGGTATTTPPPTTAPPATVPPNDPVVVGTTPPPP